MPARKVVRVQSGGSSGSLRLNLPKSWCEAIGLSVGQDIELTFDEVLVAAPGPSRQADRAKRALSEG